MAGDGFNLPTDAFVEVLLRLPTSARRRFRLVCKRWRDVVDKRTPERQVRTKTLVFISQPPISRTLVFDDKDGRRTHEWPNGSTTGGAVQMIGTCNGLICLGHGSEGDYRFKITVGNPVTGELLALPPLPLALADSSQHFSFYGFGYHPTTGQYKVVHLPSHFARRQDAVHVLTLGGGDPTWREVVSPAMAGSYNCFCGIVGVDGSVYWFTSRADRVMALDLEDERVTSFKGPPGVRAVGRTPEASWKVTNVHARLGVAVPSYEPAATRVEVWVLDSVGGGEQPRWSRIYILAETGRDARNRIVMTPHLTHGEYVLSTSWDSKRLYRRKVGGEGPNVELRPSEGEELIVSEEGEETGGWLRTSAYAYVETREPLPSARG